MTSLGRLVLRGNLSNVFMNKQIILERFVFIWKICFKTFWNFLLLLENTNNSF